MAARVPVRASIISPVNGSALVGVSLTITKHVPGKPLGEGETAKIYLGETEEAHVGSNTITSDEKGTFTQGKEASWASYWLPVGSYDYFYHGAGINSFFQVVELVSGGPESVGSEQVVPNIELKGSPTAPEASVGTETQQIASTSFVGRAVKVLKEWVEGTFAGSTHITTLGTITKGVWKGTALTSSAIGEEAVTPSALSSATTQTFLQLLTKAEQKIAFGKWEADGPAGEFEKLNSESPNSRAFGYIAHGLGQIPAVALLTPHNVAIQKSGEPTFAVAVSIVALTSSRIEVEVTSLGVSADIVVPIWWMAIA